jgi:hypothetical protein
MVKPRTIIFGSIGRPHNHDRAGRLNLTAHLQSARFFLRSLENEECLGTSGKTDREDTILNGEDKFKKLERDDPQGMIRLLSFGEGVVAYEYTDPAG